MPVGMARAVARSRNSNKSSGRKRTETLPLARTGSTCSMACGLATTAVTNAASTKRFKSTDSDALLTSDRGEALLHIGSDASGNECSGGHRREIVIRVMPLGYPATDRIRL